MYKSVVRPAMMYEHEKRAAKKVHEKKLDVAEMTMLRCMCGVRKMDRIRIERITGTTKVGEYPRKCRKEG